MKPEIFYSCLLLVTIACTADLKDDERGVVMQSYEFTAVCEDDVVEENGTKTSFTPGTGGKSGTVSWLEGDEIAVFTPAGVKYTMTALSSGSEVRFRGDLPQGTTRIYAVYPNDASAIFSDGVITTTLKSSQTATVDGFQDELAILSAAGDISDPSNVLSFKNACGLVKFQVKDEDVKKVKIVATNTNTAITGKAAVTASTGVSSAVIANNVVELVPPAGDTYFTGDKVYYFTALPGIISGFTMYYECENGIKSRSTTKSMTVSRSKISTISGNDDDPGWASDIVVASQIASSSSTVTLGWDYLGSPDPTQDYVVYLYSDQACSNFVVSWLVTSTMMGSNAPRFIFTGLTANTTYYAKVKPNTLAHYSAPVAMTTASEFTNVTVGEEGTAKEGDIILAEDFSELIWGGDYVNKACGYADNTVANMNTSKQPKFVLTTMDKAIGDQTSSTTFSVESFNRMYYTSSVLAKPIQSSTRLGDWAYRDSQEKYNRSMGMPGYLGVSNTASQGCILTPALSSMSKPATLEVSFKAAAYGCSKCSVGCLSGASVVAASGEPSTGYKLATGGTFDLQQTIDITSDWKSYSVTLEDVPAGARVAIGVADDASSTNKPHVLVDEVSIKLIRYNKDVIGNPLDPWKAGYMDIHFISSWSGECLFIAYPDGTTMIIDAAGDDSAENNPQIRSKWEEQQSGITGKCGTALVCDYISYHLNRMEKSKIDYVLLTHYHPDHMGTYHSTSYEGYKVSRTSKPTGTGSAQWTLNGITMVMEKFTVGKFVDRDYSASASESHSYPMQLYVKKSSTLKGQTSTVYPIAGNTSQGYVKLSQMNNYRYMIRSIEDNKWTTIEKFDVGSNTQFKPLYDATNYNVEVRNLGAQGLFWTGSGTSTSQIFPVGSALEYIVPTDGSSIDKDGTYGHNCPAENHNSCCLKFTWGKFTFGTFGDNTYVDSDKFSWKNAEKPISNHIGQCDLLKASHHGLDGCTSTNLTNATQPLVWVVDNWNDSQGDIGPVKRLPSTTEMYFTNMTTDILKELSSYSSRIKGYDGHVVVRVTDGGSYFRVYMLDYGKAGYPVKYVSSKFTSK